MINLVFDFDSTLVTVEALDCLAELALVNDPLKIDKRQQIAEITRAGMNGELPFNRSLAQRLALLSINQTLVNQVGQYLTTQISPSVWKHRQFLEQNKDRIYVISGGFSEYITPVITKLGLRADHCLANHFVYDQRGNVTGYDQQSWLCQAGGKAKAVAALQLSGDVVVVGDGYTDWEIKQLGAASRFIYYAENVDRPKVRALALEAVANFQELIALNI